MDLTQQQLYESGEVMLWAELDGEDVGDITEITFKADVNFNGNFDSWETQVVDLEGGYWSGTSDFPEAYFQLSNDGLVATKYSNNTLFDEIMLQVSIGTADVIDMTGTVFNLSPAFETRPQFRFEDASTHQVWSQEQSDWLEVQHDPYAAISFAISDRGLLDSHTAIIHWGDDTVTEFRETCNERIGTRPRTAAEGAGGGVVLGD
jgi:hypothetical protein